MLEQDSAYNPTSFPPGSESLPYVIVPPSPTTAERLGISVSTRKSAARPYPVDWERVAELRVFRTTPEKWTKLIGWRSEMQRKGWKLLQVTSNSDGLMAVFGRTKEELLERKETGT